MADPRPWFAHYDPDVPQTLEPYPDRTLLDYLSEAARDHPTKTALILKGHRLSYLDLEHESDALAAAFSEMGIGAGDRVALCLPNCPQFIIAEFATWKLGAIACPINPTYTDRELEEALSASGAETVVVLNRYYEKLKEIQPRTAVRRLVTTGIKEYLPFALRMSYTLLKEKSDGEHITLHDGDARFAELIAHHRKALRASRRPDPNEPAVILMSGGTTGTPKGVVGSHRNIVIAGIQLRAWLRSAMNEWTDTIMLPLPLFHTYANTGVQGLAFINHNPICLVPNPRDFGDMLKEIGTEKPAFICAVPTLLNAILNHKLALAGRVDFHSLKLCFCGAAALMAETKRRWEELTGGVIVEGYSLTEAQMAVVANPVRGEKKVGSVGMPLPDVDVRIVDADDGTTPKALGETGEIVIAAPQLMLGYWQRPDDTKQMLRRSERGERLLYTGDLGYLDPDGYVFIVDRKKDLIKTSGYQVWPREIEEVISAHPDVAEVGVVGLPDAMKGETVKAFVVVRPGTALTEAQLKSFARERLAPYKVPAHFEFVADLPKTQVGKVLRRALKDAELKKAAQASASSS